MGGTANPLAGLGTPVPSAPPPAAAANPLAGLGTPVPSTPAPVAAAVTPDITSNPKGEGVYQMKGPKGAIGIPYSNVETAKGQGYDFDWANTNEGERYGDDQMADPHRQRDFMERLAAGGMDAFKAHASGAVELLRKVNAGMASPADVIAYKRENPTATDEQAMNAVTGHDLMSAATGKPYRGTESKQTDQELRSASDWFKKQMSGQDNGVAGWLGGGLESVAELFGPAEMMKLAEAPAAAGEVASAADKMSGGAKLASMLKNYPKIARLVGLGVQTLKASSQAGALTAGQTYVDTGGDTHAALTAGAEGAALGGGMTGVFGGVQTARAMYAAKAADASKGITEFQEAMQNYRQQVAERLTQTDAQNADYQTAKETQATEHAKAMEAHNQALTDRANAMDKARAEWKAQIEQQGKAHATAMDAYNQQVAETGTANADAKAAWKAQLDEQAAKHANDVAEYQQQLNDHNQTVSALKNEATTALRTQRQIEAQQGIRNTAKDATQDAITRFNAARGVTNFEPVDAVESSKDVGTFGDMSDAIQDAAKPVYERINEVTENKFGDLQKQRAAAMRAQDFDGVTKAEAKIDTLLEKNPGVTPEEYRAAKSAWRDSKDADRIHNAVEGAFNGISDEMAAQPGTGSRAVKGELLQSRLGGLLRGAKAMTPERISQLIGQDGLAGLYRAAHMTSTPELRAATQKLVQEIAAALPVPEAPVKPDAIAKPATIAAPEAPVKPGAIPKPEAPPVPTAPVRPAPVKAPKALPRPTRPTPQVRETPTQGIVQELGKSTFAGAAGGLIGPHVGLSPAQGASTAVAMRFVLRQMVTNPAVGKMMQYAVDYGATPERAAKIVAAMISKANEGSENGSEQPTGNSEQEKP